MDLDAEIACTAGLLAGTRARRWQQPAEHCPGWPERQPRLGRLQRAADRGGQQRRGRAGAEPGHLPVAEPAAIGPALQRVAAAYHAGIDPGHRERAGPHPQLAVVPGPARVALVAQVGFGGAIRAERIGIADHPATLRAGLHLLLLAHHRRQRAAADPASQGRHHQRRVPQVAGVIGAGGQVQPQHPQIGRDRVKPAAVHDPRARGCGDIVAAVDAVPDEQHLAGQVRVIGARLGAGLNQREPVRAIGAHGAHHHPGRPGQRRHRHRIGRIGDQQRPGRRGDAQPRPDIGQPPLRPSRKPDAHAARRMTGQVAGHQPSDETGGAEHHDV
jgi:hypothetical protein